MAIDDVTGDQIRSIDEHDARILREAAIRAREEDDARALRATTMMARNVPYAKMDQIGLEFVVLNPGEAAVLPVEWHQKGRGVVRQLSTHPEAPVGLAVRPAAEPLDISGRMSLIVDNEAEMPITVTENDYVAVGVEEGALGV